jgi:hypothetical protein
MKSTSSVNFARPVAPSQSVQLSDLQKDAISAVVSWQKQLPGPSAAMVKAAAREIAQAVRSNKSLVLLYPAVLRTPGFDAVRDAMAAAGVNVGERLYASEASANVSGVDDARAENPAAVNQLLAWAQGAKGPELVPLVNTACEQILSGIAQGSNVIEVQCDRRVVEQMPVPELFEIKLNWTFVGEVQEQDAGHYVGPGSILPPQEGGRASWSHSSQEEALHAFGRNSISGHHDDGLDSKHGFAPEPVSPVSVSPLANSPSTLSPAMKAHLANVQELQAVSTNLMAMGLKDGTGFDNFRAAVQLVRQSISAALPAADQAAGHKNLNTKIESIALEFGNVGNNKMQNLMASLVPGFSPPQG